MFAILFGCKHFHQNVYGQKVHVEGDHKPLISIMSKPLHAALTRLQHTMLQLQRYALIMHHLSGKSIPMADNYHVNFCNIYSHNLQKAWMDKYTQYRKLKEVKTTTVAVYAKTYNLSRLARVPKGMFPLVI